MTSLQELASRADGDSVTAARLAGEEKYFPDCRPFLAGLEPQHLVLLTTGAATIERDDGQTNRRRSADDGGVAVVGDRSLLVVVDDHHWEFPYHGLGGVGHSDGRIQLYVPGQWLVKLRVASSADDDEVAAGLHYCRGRLREA